jgi:hypothetical protein
MTKSSKSAKHRSSSDKLDRRAFLKTAGLGVIAGGASALNLGAAEAASAAEEPPAGGRYRDTEHVRRAYALARF